MKLDLHRPWLVAAWPGMGAVAQIAGNYLVQRLGARPVAEVQPGDYFDLQSISVREGLVQEAEVPRSVFYGWKNPGSGRDLLVFCGDAQPAARGYRFSEELVRVARELDAEEVFTFAAMATPMHPSATPRVFAVATHEPLLTRVRKEEVEVLAEGEISGLNGVFLAAAARAGLGCTCLLGEFPYFASAIPNPKASSAVLRIFSNLSGVVVDRTELDEQAQVLERRLVEHLERLQSGESGPLVTGEPPPDWPEPEREPELAPDVEARIEAMFRAAADDRRKAPELKAELDRHGVFKRYEDRFLDLFRRAE